MVFKETIDQKPHNIHNSVGLVIDRVVGIQPIAGTMIDTLAQMIDENALGIACTNSIELSTSLKQAATGC